MTQIKRSHLFMFFIITAPVIIFISCQSQMKKKAWKDDGYLYEMTYYGDTAKTFFGIVDIHYPTGEKFGRYYVKDGMKEGVSKYFNKDGKLVEETDFNDGRPNGFHTEFYPDGKLKVYAIYNYNTAIYALVFDQSGKIKKTHWAYDINAPDTIKLGEEYLAKIRVPLMKGFDTITDF